MRSLLLIGFLLGQLALTASTSARSPDAHRPLSQTVSGRLLVLDDAGGPSRYVVEGRAGMSPVAAQPGFPGLVGRRVELRDGTLVADAPTPSPRTTGTLRTLVIMVAYADVPGRPYDAGQTAAVMGGATTSVDGLYRAQSGGSTRIATEVVPQWVQSSQVVPTGRCFDTSFAADAAAGAREQGFDPDAYDRVVVVLNANSCPGQYAGYAPIMGRFAYINSLTVRVVAHELGHTLGAQHASSTACVDADGHPVTLHAPGSGSCATNEYGDPFDAMGAVYPSRLMSVWHRAQLGQLPGRPLTPTQSGTYTVDPAPGDGQTLVTIPRQDDAMKPVVQWFAVELRAPTEAFDTFAATDPAVTGVSVRLVFRPSTTGKPILLDTHPATATATDAPLQPGETFTDPATGIAVRVDEVTDGRATITTTQPTRLDASAPSTPGAPMLSRVPSGVRLEWTRSDDDVANAPAYEVTCDGSLVARTAQTTAVAADRSDGPVRTCSIVAIDNADHRSQPATGTLDVEPPTSPTDLRLERTPRGATLSWSAGRDDRGVDGYEISRAGLTRRIAHTAWEDPSAPSGAVQYAVVTLDAAGNRSPPATGTLQALAEPSRDAPARPPAPTPTDQAPSVDAVPAPPRPRAFVLPVPAVRLVAPRLAHGRARLPRDGVLRFSARGGRPPLRLTVRVGRRTVRTRTLRLTRAERRRATVVAHLVDAGGRTAVLRLVVRKGLVRAVPG